MEATPEGASRSGCLTGDRRPSGNTPAFVPPAPPPLASSAVLGPSHPVLRHQVRYATVVRVTRPTEFYLAQSRGSRLPHGATAASVLADGVPSGPRPGMPPRTRNPGCPRGPADGAMRGCAPSGPGGRSTPQGRPTVRRSRHGEGAPRSARTPAGSACDIFGAGGGVRWGHAGGGSARGNRCVSLIQGRQVRHGLRPVSRAASREGNGLGLPILGTCSQSGR